MHQAKRFAGLVLLVALPAVAQQQPVVLTLSDALARARQSAPSVVAARMRIEETRARLLSASLPFSTNPTLDVEAGRRDGDVASTDYAIEVGQDISPPRRRGARIDAVRAAIAGEEQRAREVEREALSEIATTFVRAIEARERAEAAASGKRLADEALRIAQRRFSAGDVAQLDVNLARTAIARADAEQRAADASLLGHTTRLQVLLGSAGPVVARGSLSEPLLSINGLVPDRADLRLLDAEIAEAEAEGRFARTLRWPDVGLRASYGREEGDRIVLGGVGVTLPVLHRGQEAAAFANARAARLRSEREALQRTVDAEVRGAAARFEALQAVAAEYERTVVPLIEENERLALESYEVGQIGLADLLLVRREALDTRRSLIDQLIETRLAEIELHARTGVWK